MRLKIFSVKPYTNTTPPRLTLCMYVSTDLEREREWSAKQNTEREREREILKKKKRKLEELDCVAERKRERERENLMLVTVCCFASAYTTLLFCQLMMMMAVCFARGLSRGLAVTSFLKLIEKCVFLFSFFGWFYEDTYIFYKTHVMLMSTL